MTPPLPPTRRRAQRFAERVDGVHGRPDAGPDAGPDAELLALVGALRSVPQAQPRPAFSADLRERLMTAAATELATAAGDSTTGRDPRLDARLTVTPGAGRRPRERRIAVALGALAIVGSSTSMAVASQSALPGDALYPLKRVIENTHANLSPGDQGKGTTLLHNAGDRLDEAQQLTRDGQGDPGRVGDTLDAFTSQLTQGADLLMQDYRDHGTAASIDTLRRFDASSMLTLTALDGTIPDGSEPALLAAAQQLFTIDAQAGQLCPACSTAGIKEIPPTLLASDADTTTPPAVLPSSPVTTGLPGTPGGRAGVDPSASAAPSTDVTVPPSATATATATPSSAATSAGTRSPGTGGSATAHPSSLVSSLVGGLTGHGTASARPTPLPSPSQLLPSVVPSVSAVVSGLATAVASGVDGLVGGLGSGSR